MTCTCDGCTVKQRLKESTAVDSDVIDRLDLSDPEVVDRLNGLVDAVETMARLNPADVTWNDDENVFEVEGKDVLKARDDGSLFVSIPVIEDGATVSLDLSDSAEDRQTEHGYAKVPEGWE